jgi:hypothetical protein
MAKKVILYGYDGYGTAAQPLTKVEVKWTPDPNVMWIDALSKDNPFSGMCMKMTVASAREFAKAILEMTKDASPDRSRVAVI